ncbi:HAD-IA family hydrolase [Agarivorans sp. 1_MG-2023]|uniref:HAD-IA family hydrolase n=1 Tax=Agarivorans sp. 1_MG-2023 TaxID=3062634 RepID=UPI0026E23710|nr:HAD-IA family hydrolase [Agarivorans sp. 1_MG-2023]MDO6764400.1 HAD-IA family hydrolase [Agarivorans sp. 1_MG-2023]
MIFYRSWSPVQALSFDLDDTLYDNWPYIHRAEQWLINHLKTEVHAVAHLTTSQWQSYKRRIIKKHPELKGDVSACRVAWLSLAFVEHGMPITEAQHQAEQIFQQFLAVRSDFTVPEASLALLRKLKTRYRLVAITNGNVDIDKIGLAGVFELELKAGGAFKAKPAADMYLYASQVLGLAPHQIAHVGDHCVTDVAGAAKAGYRSIWLNQHSQQARKLQALPDIEISQLAQLQHLL